MKLHREADILHGTVGILGFFGIAEFVQLVDRILSPFTSSALAQLVCAPVIVWGGLSSYLVTYKAFKGGFSDDVNARK